MKYKLMPHQASAVEDGKDKSLALFFGCGCGKCLTAIELIKHHKGPALVVSPLTLIENSWRVDCNKFAPELSVVSLWSKKPAERRERLAEKHDIYLVNFEGFKGLFDAIQKKKFNVIVVDESAALKNVNSAITRALLAMAGIKLRKRGGRVYPVNHIIPYRYCLSGCPAPNSDLEYYAQMKFITGPGDECFSDNFYSFRRMYAYGIPLSTPGQMIWKQIPAMRNQLLESMKPYSRVVMIEDVLDLLPQRHIVRTVDLTTPERVAYDTFKNDLVLRFKDETVLASTALVAVMKLRQLTSGFMYGNDGLHWIGNTKLNELLEVLEEIGDNKVLIWANFREEIEMLNKAIPGSKTLYGGTKDKDDSISDFRDGDCKVLIANPMSAAHGLTFVGCHYNILFSLSYSYEFYEQLIHRTYRYGQKEGVIYYYIIAKNSIDEVVYNAVQSKGDMSSAALQFLKGK